MAPSPSVGEAPRPTDKDTVIASWTDAKDSEYLARLATRGYDLSSDNRRIDAITAGKNLCLAWLNGENNYISAQIPIKRDYDFSRGQIADVAVTAIDVYCPSEAP